MKLSLLKILFISHKLKYLLITAVFLMSGVFLGQKVLAQTETIPAPFVDVSNISPYYVSISYLKEKGFITGYEDSTFIPDARINKVEALRLILTSAQVVSDEAFKPFYPDVTDGQWFTSFVIKAHHLGIVKGNEDGMFRPAEQVKLAEFLKMLLIAHNIDVASVHGRVIIPNIAPADWFADYLNYAVELGILSLTSEGTLDPAKVLSRGEVADMIYLLLVMKQGNDPNFLLVQAKAQLAQIEVYVTANDVHLAKNASELAVQFTQQAYKSDPLDPIILGDAKLARAYDWLVDSIMLGIQKKNEEASQKANEAIDKATEAWEVNHDTQPLAAHIKEKAREILVQVGGVEG